MADISVGSRAGFRAADVSEAARLWRSPPDFGAVDFLNARFHRAPSREVYARAAAARHDEPFRYIVTPNVDHVVRLNAEPDELTALYDDAWISTCDSRILELLAKASGLDLEATPGSDLTAWLFETQIDRRDPINIIGGDEDVVGSLIARYDLKDARWHEPPMGLRRNPEAIADIARMVAASPARYTFFCVGSPQQEMAARACLKRGDAKGVGLCVGASLEFITGKTERAPKWMQEARLEWAHRLASEPERLWKRYLVEGPKVFRIWMDWRTRRAAAGAANATPSARRETLH